MRIWIPYGSINWSSAKIVNLFNSLKNFNIRKHRALWDLFFPCMLLICPQGRTKPDPGAETTTGWGLLGLSPGWPGEREKEAGGAGAEAAEGGRGAAAEVGRGETAAGEEPVFIYFWWLSNWSFLKCERKKLDRIVSDLNSPCHFNIYYIFTKSIF